MPAHWKPSKLAIPLSHNTPMADRMETLRDFNISRSSVGGIDSVNRLYEVVAESPDTVAPFLRENMQQDYRQRSLTDRKYVVLQGGDILQHTGDDTAHRVDLSEGIPR